jgi:hypothetical protein
LGEVAGHSTSPLSPLEAMYVMPGVAKFESYASSLSNSLNPQLIETTVTPGVLLAVCTAVIKLASAC